MKGFGCAITNSWVGLLYVDIVWYYAHTGKMGGLLFVQNDLKAHWALWWLHSQQQMCRPVLLSMCAFGVSMVYAYILALRTKTHALMSSVWLIIRHWITPKLTSPLCIVKVKMSHGQNDMNKSIFAPPSSSCMLRRKLHINLRGQETSAYFPFVPCPLPLTEGHHKPHFSHVRMEQRGILRPTLFVFLSPDDVGGYKAERN